MADASRDPSSLPGWRDAFAALPLESPTTSRWAAIDAALSRHDMPGHAVDDDSHDDAPVRAASPWPRRVAWAAVLATLALPVLFRLLPDEAASSRTPFAAAPRPAAPAASTATVAAEPVAPAPPASTRTAETQPPVATQSAARIAHATAPPRNRPERHQPQRYPPAPTPQAKSWPRARLATDHDDASLQAAFEPYYAEAAQLERIIAAARDPRVGSGPAASLAGALDAEVATIDARLAGPGLETGQRLALWRERVDVLRASAELESQLRLLAAEGDALDGALVRVD